MRRGQGQATINMRGWSENFNSLFTTRLFDVPPRVGVLTRDPGILRSGQTRTFARRITALRCFFSTSGGRVVLTAAFRRWCRLVGREARGGSDGHAVPRRPVRAPSPAFIVPSNDTRRTRNSFLKNLALAAALTEVCSRKKSLYAVEEGAERGNKVKRDHAVGTCVFPTCTRI